MGSSCNTGKGQAGAQKKMLKKRVMAWKVDMHEDASP